MSIPLMNNLAKKADAAVKATSANAAGAASLIARAASGTAGIIVHDAFERSEVVSGAVDGVVEAAVSKVGEIKDAVKAKSPEAVVKRAKISSFRDGINEGARLMAEKAYAYSYALVALTTYVARCDGEVADAEIAQLRTNLKHLRADENMPELVRERLIAIADNNDLAFEDVASYLDTLGVATLENLRQELDDAIEADGMISPDEERVRGEFADYLENRRAHEADSDE